MASARVAVHRSNGMTPLINTQKCALYKGELIKDPDKMSCRTPIRSGRIAPEVHRSSAPNAAWSNQKNTNNENKSDFIEHNISRKCSTSSELGEEEEEEEEEKSVLLDNSKRILIQEGLNTPPFIQHKDLKTCSKYISLPRSGNQIHNENSLKNNYLSQYDNLSPLSTSSSYLDNDTISIDIMRNIKKRKKTKRSYMKFFCPPYFTLAISLLEVAVFFCGWKELGYIFVYSPHNREQVWRFISYMLLHSGGIHLTLNIIIQILLATPLEMEQGSWRCAVVYLGGVLAGALGASVIQPTLYMVGASAGVYSLLMSYLSGVALRFSTMRYKKFRIFAVLVLVGSDVAFLMAHRWSAPFGALRIGWAAHCTGAVAGVLLGLLVYTGSDQEKVHIKIARWISFGIICVGVAASILCNIFLIDLT